MNNLEYLNQISQSTRPVNPNSANAFPFKLIFKILGGALLAFVALIIISSAMGNASQKVSNLTAQVYTRANNLNKTVKDYNKLVKSSRLRSIGISLSGALTGGTNQISSYVTETSGKKQKNPLQPPEKTLAEETEMSNTLNETLKNARLNGILDRVYANQIQLQVSLLMSLCSELNARTKNDQLRDITNQMSTNLQAIDESFASYSNLGS